MHPLDFINESPTFYILQKDSIKTNLGGFFIIIYIIIMLAVCLYYFIHYFFLDDPYLVQTLNHFNIKSDEEIEQRNKNDLFNQNIMFSLDLLHMYNDTPISNKFTIVDKNHTIGRGVDFKRKVSDFQLFVVYECDTPNCSDYLDFAKNSTEEYYRLYFVQEGFILSHQNKNEPIQRKENNSQIYFLRTHGFKYNILNYEIIYIWENIIYRETKLFSDNYEDSCGYIDNYYQYILDQLLTVNINNKSYAIVNNITLKIDYTKYIEYKRTRYSELDLLANIASLFSNIFFIARFIFTFYANHFNNFKIVENILSRNHKIIITNSNKKNKSLELADFLNEENNKFMPLNKDIGEIDGKSSDNNVNFQINRGEIDDKNEVENSEGNSLELRKLHFYDFFINNFYFDRCCKNRKSQKIIDVCDRILCKYASIDTIVYNQLLLENLLKDYKWNDPKLNNVTSNNLFSELKSYL